MRLDILQSPAGGHNGVSPMQIAHHPLFTPREKIEMLEELKAGIASASHRTGLGFDPVEIDEAIEDVRTGAEDGIGSETTLRGDA